MRSLLTGLLFGGLFLIVVETIWTLATGLHQNVHLDAPFYLASMAAMTMGLWLLHALPAVGLFKALERWFSDPRPILIGAAALLGFSMQRTLMGGDGISAHPHYLWIQIGFGLAFPAIFATATWLILVRRFNIWLRRGLTAMGIIGCGVFNALVLTEYQPFHGHLAAFYAALFVGLLAPLWKRPWPRRLAVVVALMASMATLYVATDQERARTHTQRFSHIPASMAQGLPLGGLLQVQPEPLFEVGEADPEVARAIYDEHFHEPQRFEAGERRGEHVLFIVLEAMRADYWDDPHLARHFDGWKDQGVHFPESIANYPATPLAYGAMFTAQPPSVVAQTPYWSEDRLFDPLVDEFDHLFLSRPDISWFEHTAITDFFLPRDHPVNAHETGADGLEFLRDEIADVDDSERFFGWIHLYEPHHPYEEQEPWIDDVDPDLHDDHRAYRSEIAYTDDHLGRFMDWFYDQPFADDTLVVLVADHGQAMGEEIMGEPYWGHHVHVHNVITDIPMYVSGPQLPADHREEVAIPMQLDVMPTLYDYLGLALPQAMMPQGNSIYHLLDERPTRPLVTEAFSIRGGPFFEFVASAQQGDDVRQLRREFHRISTDGQRYSPKIGIQYGDHKLIYDRLLQRAWLYNIADDPREQRDLFDDEPETAQKMTELLRDWTLMQGEVVRSMDELLLD